MGEIRLLARMLRELTVGKNRSVIFIAPPWKPNLAALRAMKIAVNKLVWVKAPEDQVLWAAEQSLKQEGIGAVLIWLPQARPEALRRLQVAAQEARSLAFLFRPHATDRVPCPWGPVKRLGAPGQWAFAPGRTGSLGLRRRMKRGRKHRVQKVLP